jgi:hypothetical protein
MDLNKVVQEQKVDETGSGPCTIMGLGISSVDPLGSTVPELDMLCTVIFLLYEPLLEK